ncbi:MAG: hypothetical protein GY720_00180 [bacterium]|nr:hypothetical protein [bacterium]
MLTPRIVARGFLWGIAIGTIAGSLYGVLFLVVLDPRGRWSLIGGLGAIYSAPVGAALGLLFGALTASAVTGGSTWREANHDMARALMYLCAIVGGLGLVVAVAVSRTGGTFPEGVAGVTIPALIAWFVGRTAIPRFAKRYLPIDETRQHVIQG